VLWIRITLIRFTLTHHLDPHHLDADPDSTYNPGADPDFEFYI
jgi:hypothetical protein